MNDKLAAVALLALASACADDRPVVLELIQTMEGTLTWEVVFPNGDECWYARTYEAVEDRSAPWLCPECETVWRAELVDFDGEDCFDRVSTATAPPSIEWLGAGGGGFYRATAVNTRLIPLGAAADGGEILSVDHTTELDTEEGLAALHIIGDLDRGVIIGDPYHGWRPPPSYACGWPKEVAPAYQGDWILAKGKTVPDGIFRDRCDEPVRLHDMIGRYIVIDLAASDCAPCQVMADGERAFIEDMASSGVPVEVVTLMVPSLGAVLTPTPTSLLDEWSSYYRLDSPVLGDRGWGVFVAASAMTQFGYPTSIVVGPDLEVVDISIGFGSWAYHRDLIVAHAR